MGKLFALLVFVCGFAHAQSVMMPGPGLSVALATTAPSFVASATNGGSRDYPCATVRSGVTDGDQLVLLVSNDDGNPSSYTVTSSGADGATGWTTTYKTSQFVVLTKMNAKSDDTTLTITNSSTFSMTCGVFDFTGGDTSAQAFTASGADGGGGISPWSQVSGSVTPSVNKTLVLAAMFSSALSNFGGNPLHTFSTSTGTSNAWTTAANYGTNAYEAFALGYASQNTAGALAVTGTGTLSLGITASTSLVLIGLKPK